MNHKWPLKHRTATAEENEMEWNTNKIGFLHRPDDFLGSFTNDLMQLRHEKQVREKLQNLKDSLAAEENPTRAMLILNKRDHVQFLRNNIEIFRQHEEFESALLRLYRRKNGPFSTPNDLDTWKEFFALVDRDLILQLGVPLPFTSTIVYRGSVIGTNRALSWSPDHKRATQFAERCKDPALGGGQLFEVDVAAANTLVYLTDKTDHEIILDPEFINSAEIRPFSNDK